MRILSILFFCFLYLPFLQAQVVKSVVLDEVMIAAVRKGFDVNDFVNMVKSDTSFWKGFTNLRNAHHLVEGTIEIYGKKNKIKASRYRKAIQVTKANRRWITIVEEKVSGDFYDRKEEPEYYTAELFDELFFYKDTLAPVAASESVASPSGTNNSSNIGKLKKLVFNPGSEIEGVPVVGKRMAIFDDDMVKYYDYSISSKTYNDTVSCYVFSCIAKPEAGDYPVLKFLNTWFDATTLQIVYRDYRYQYSGLLFDFDVTMKVTMNYDFGLLYPSKIEYTGFWDLPVHKKEKVDFNLDFKLLRPKSADR